MKRKGFTLIELLAVIVILAVIALIATPMIMNYIEDARDGALKATARNIIDTGEKMYAKELLDNPNETPVISFDELEYQGEQMEQGTIEFDEQGLASIAIFHQNKCIYKNPTDKDVILDKTLDETECLQKLGEILIQGVTLDKTSLIMSVGGSEILKATIIPETTTQDKTLIWESSNPEVATVTNGVVQAVGLGKTTITVKTLNGKTATCEVTTEIAITGVSLNQTTLNLNPGGTATLVATITPEDASMDKTLTWESSNPEVATVTDGIVTAVGEGNATITVKTTNGHTATCEVTVKKPTLIDNIINQPTTPGEGFQDQGNGNYIYKGKKGTGGTNWLWFGGHLWRIMKVNTNNNRLSLITSYPVTVLTWGSEQVYPKENCIEEGTCTTLETSDVGQWLNDEFLSSLSDETQSMLLPMTYTRKVYNGSSVVNEEISDVKVRLLTYQEYNDFTDSRDDYLNIVDLWWLADIKSSSTVDSIYVTGNQMHSEPSELIGVRPVIKISDFDKFEGNGTLTDPYVLETTKATTTNEMEVGTYVSIPMKNGGNYLARVVKHDQGGTKVVLNGVYGVNIFCDDCLIPNVFSDTIEIYTETLTEFKNTLDSKYFDSSKRNFDITHYDSLKHELQEEKYFNGNIGLLSYGEMLSGNDLDLSLSTTKTFVDSSKILNPDLSETFWHINTETTAPVYYVDGSAGILFVKMPTAENGVRPTWYITNTSIVGGNGTASDPYRLK